VLVVLLLVIPSPPVISALLPSSKSLPESSCDVAGEAVMDDEEDDPDEAPDRSSVERLVTSL